MPCAENGTGQFCQLFRSPWPTALNPATALERNFLRKFMIPGELASLTWFADQFPFAFRNSITDAIFCVFSPAHQKFYQGPDKKNPNPARIFFYHRPLPDSLTKDTDKGSSTIFARSGLNSTYQQLYRARFTCQNKGSSLPQ